MGLFRRSPAGKKSYYFGAVIFVLLSLSVGHEKERADFVTENWVRTDGVITDSEVVRYTGGRMQTADAFGIRLWYRYRAAGGEYYGGPVEADRGTIYTHRSAEKAVRRGFSAGSPIEVYFDPTDPSASALGSGHAPGRPWQVFLLLVALVFIYLAQNAGPPEQTRRM